MRSRPNTKALATNESDDSEGDGEDKNDDGLTLDDEDSETDCTGTGTDDFTAHIEGSTIGLKDDLESMRDENSEDEKETGNDVEAEADKTPKTRGGGSIKLGKNHGKCSIVRY